MYDTICHRLYTYIHDLYNRYTCALSLETKSRGEACQIHYFNKSRHNETQSRSVTYPSGDVIDFFSIITGEIKTGSNRQLCSAE